jgi:hypothetical protein
MPCADRRVGLLEGRVKRGKTDVQALDRSSRSSPFGDVRVEPDLSASCAAAYEFHAEQLCPSERVEHAEVGPPTQCLASIVDRQVATTVGDCNGGRPGGRNVELGRYDRRDRRPCGRRGSRDRRDGLPAFATPTGQAIVHPEHVDLRLGEPAGETARNCIAASWRNHTTTPPGSLATARP